jgi:hypothetical protein
LRDTAYFSEKTQIGSVVFFGNVPKSAAQDVSAAPRARCLALC